MCRSPLVIKHGKEKVPERNGDLVIIELNEYDVQTYGEAFGAFTQYIDDN
jgi:hypothetical protein